jgi:hypothetical protein
MPHTGRLELSSMMFAHTQAGFSYVAKKSGPLPMKRAGFPRSAFRGSERNLASQLPVSGNARCRRSSEVPVQQMGIDVRQVGAVEEIEDFKPELEVDPFSNTSVLVKVDVGLGKVWSTELSGLLAALGTESRRSELTRSKAAIEKCGASGLLAVVTRIRVVEPNTVDRADTIGVVVSASCSVAYRVVPGRRARRGSW